MFNPTNNSVFNSSASAISAKFPAGAPLPGKNFLTAISCLCVVLLAAGCASTNVITNPQMAANEKLPRPGHIWVYDFVPGASGQAAAEQAQVGREIAANLAKSIRGMGLPAEQATAATRVQINDILFKGTILSLDEGNATKRIAIGFGSGASELKVGVESYQMTAHGLRQLGSGTGDAGGSKSPGAALGVIGTIATANPAGLIVSTGMKAYGEASGSSKVEGRSKQIVEEIVARIKPRFQQQGWIQ